ncbi:MAG: hypothetical protein AAGA84_10135 [Pseudomonadota bacterium]
MTQFVSPNSTDTNWIAQLIGTIQNNPELAVALQGLASQLFANPAQPTQDPARVSQYVDAEYDDTPMPTQADHDDTDDVLALFADAFGFCAQCVVCEELCESCAAGVPVDGPDDETFLALVTPVLPQLTPQTRLTLARELQKASQDTNPVPAQHRRN